MVGRPVVAVAEGADELERQLADFFAMHYDRLVRLAGLICHATTSIDDAVQAAMEQAWRRRHTLREPERLRPWLDQIVVREAIRQNRKPWWSRLGIAAAEDQVPRARDRRGDVNPTWIALTDAFRGLPAEQRAVVAPHLYEGYPVDAAFGEVVTTRDTTTVRCGVVDEAAARELAGSLNALPLAMHDEEELYTEDLSARVFIYIATGYPQAADCEVIATVTPEPTPAPPATPRAGDDLAGVEPCGLVPQAVDDMLGGTTERASEPAFVDFGAPARTCFIREVSEFGHAATHLAVTLYPRSTDLDDAAGLASAVLGGGHVADTVNGTPVWFNDCLAEALACSGAAVVSSGPHALVIEAPGDPVGGGPGMTLEQIRRVIAAIVGNR